MCDIDRLFCNKLLKSGSKWVLLNTDRCDIPINSYQFELMLPNSYYCLCDKSVHLFFKELQLKSIIDSMSNEYTLIM